MTILPEFTEADRLEQIAINLFHGWGYNFYRLENQLRADDQLVRAKVGALLGAARRSVDLAEADWRRTRLPASTRENPRPDPEAVAGAQRLERLSGAIGALSGQVQAQPVPENDRMTQRYHSERASLDQLIHCDRLLAAQAEVLRSTLEGRPGVWMIDNAVAIEEGLTAIGAALRRRQTVLL